MNYRHAFHAGNFADLFKHAVLLALLAEMTRDRTPVQVLDTHAGAGVYDLGGVMAIRSGEAAAGIDRLLAAPAAPAVFDRLKAAVRALNAQGGRSGGGRLYPGSPLLALQALRPQDSFVGCELRPDDHQLLVQALAAHGRAKGTALQTDGYAEAARPAASGRGTAAMRRLVLIDPPFEAADEYSRVVETVAAILGRDPRTAIAIWLPLKDLDTLDRFITALEDLEPPSVLIAEVRLRPLDQPLKMNGCAMVVIGASAEVEAQVRAAADWIVGELGDPGGEARLWRAGTPAG